MSFLSNEGDGGSESRLRRKDKWYLLACLLITGAALAVGITLYPRVNPEASIRFDVDRKASERTALDFLQKLAVPTAGYHHAARFTYDEESKVFLERTMGPQEANKLMEGTVRMWRWGHRWFRPLQKEEVSVEVATTGQIASFDHQIAEDAAGADLSAEDARALAEQLLSGPLGINLQELRFLDVRSEKRPHRTDHTFTWKRAGLDWQGGDLRLDVRIQGDRPGAYREYVHVPESWSRDYARLRSRNDTTAMVASGFLLLTFVAVVIVLLVRIRLRDVRWKTAVTFGAIGTVLQFLAGLNALPGSLYRYDTTASFSGFLLSRIFTLLLGGLALGVAIFVLTAAAEPLYRESYPGKISLSRFFTRRGLRTRRFLLSAVAGLTMTAFFFCYQEVFYSVALKLGAWAPMDVPYDELLNTAFPWVFILLFGFFPAVTEEFLSRMFSIPFLQKYTRSTLLAVVVPALIWGFAHSNYPNQPFYIRGVEVGTAGILIGLVMLRINILATLVWHFTVDALYTSFLLFRSGNAYYIISAALAGGLILVPLAYAAAAYLRRGRFEEPEGLRNADEAAPSPAAPVEERPEEAPEAAAAEMVRPWPARKRFAVALSAAVSLLLLLIPARGVEDAAPLRVSKADAVRQARGFLRATGEDPDSFRTAVFFEKAADERADRYILQHAGVSRLREEYADFLPPLQWHIRFYRPLVAREISVSLDANGGRLTSLDRHLAERDSLPSVSADSAEALARGFLARQGVDLSAFDLKDASEEKRPRRVDRTFIWEAREGDPRNVALAHHRVRVLVQGDQIGAYKQFLKLPEDWVRAREKSTALGALRLILRVAVLGTLLGLLLWMLVQAHRSGEIRWKRILLWSVPLGALALAGGLNGWPQFLGRYDTSIPWKVYMITFAVSMMLATVVGYLLAAFSFGLATAAWPQGWSLRRASFRRRQLLDAVLAALAVLAFRSVLGHLGGLWPRLWPTVAPVPEVAAPNGTTAVLPWFEVFFNAIRATMAGAAVAAGILGLLRLRSRYFGWTLLLIVLAVVAFVPLDDKTGGEFLFGLLWTAARVAVLLGLARWLLPRNLLALPLALYLGIAVQGVSPFLGAESAYFQTNGWIAALLLVLPLLWLVLSSSRGRRQAESIREGSVVSPSHTDVR